MGSTDGFCEDGMLKSYFSVYITNGTVLLNPLESAVEMFSVVESCSYCCCYVTTVLGVVYGFVCVFVFRSWGWGCSFCVCVCILFCVYLVGEVTRRGRISYRKGETG